MEDISFVEALQQVRDNQEVQTEKLRLLALEKIAEKELSDQNVSEFIDMMIRNSIEPSVNQSSPKAASLPPGWVVRKYRAAKPGRGYDDDNILELFGITIRKNGDVYGFINSQNDNEDGYSDWLIDNGIFGNKDGTQLLVNFAINHSLLVKETVKKF